MRVAAVVCWVAFVGLQAAELPEPPFGKWDYRANGQIRSQAGTNEPSRIPEAIWSEAGRRVVVIPVANLESARTMQKDGTWGRFLLERMPSPEDAFQTKFPELLEKSAITELEPILTQEQEAYRKTLPMRLLAPLPDTLKAVTEGTAEIMTWRITPDRRYARITVVRQSIPRDRSNRGGAMERIFFYDQGLSPDDAAFCIFSERRDIELRDYAGHKLLWSDRAYGFQPGDPHFEWFHWQSGRVIVCLRVPLQHARELVDRYLERYPPTWDATVMFDAKDLVLRILDRSLASMQKNVEGPLEFLRFSFRAYPFDLAFYDALNVLLATESNHLRKHHEDAIDAIQREWAASPIDDLRLDDYRSAMRDHRNGLITSIAALRDRIVQHGFKRNAKGFYVYGDVTE